MFEKIFKKHLMKQVYCPACLGEDVQDINEGVVCGNSITLYNKENRDIDNKVILNFEEEFSYECEGIKYTLNKESLKKYDVVERVDGVGIVVIPYENEQHYIGIIFDWIEVHKIVSKLQRSEYAEYPYLVESMCMPIKQLLEEKYEILNTSRYDLKNSHLISSIGTMYLSLEDLKRQCVLKIQEMEKQIKYLS